MATDITFGHTYDVTGNIIHVYPFSPGVWGNWRASPRFRQELFGLTQNLHVQVDSIMVLDADTDKPVPFMHVYEPRGNDGSGLPGSWSTMCGNGIRAVAKFLQQERAFSDDIKVATESGLITASFVSQTDCKVNMGYVTFDSYNLSRYVRSRQPGKLTDFYLDEYRELGRVSVGFPHQSGGSDEIDGEPHLLVETIPQLSLHGIQTLAQTFGEILTLDGRLFPLEINTSFYSILRHDETNKLVEVQCATFERGVYYVTGSCGTANVTTGAKVFQKLDLNDDYEVVIHNIGGTLRVTREGGVYFVTGSVTKIES